MDDVDDPDTLYNLISKCVLIESLKDTLDQFVEGYYITKESSNKIIKEAIKEYEIALKNNKKLFSKQFVFGQLLQYKYLNQLWTFNVKNPLICTSLSTNNSDANDGHSGSLGDDFESSHTPRSKSNLSKEISKNLTTKNYKVHCFRGCLKIMAVEEF